VEDIHYEIDLLFSYRKRFSRISDERANLQPEEYIRRQNLFSDYYIWILMIISLKKLKNIYCTGPVF
jgi:hypothetical protein